MYKYTGLKVETTNRIQWFAKQLQKYRRNQLGDRVWPKKVGFFGPNSVPPA
jgi:hypothetical protein